METSSVFQHLQELPKLGTLDVASLKPIVTVDANAIVLAIEQLWDAVQKQRTTMEAMEREGARKRTEQDVKISNLQSEVESKIHGEARKRQQEDDKLRAELQRTREELSQLLEKMKSDMGSLEGAVSSSVDTTLAQIKLALAQQQQKTVEVVQRVGDLEESSATAKSDLMDVQRKLDFEVDRLNELNHNLYSLWSVTPSDVSTAIREEQTVGLLHKTPAIAAILDRLTSTDEKVSGVRREVQTTAVGLQDLTKRVQVSENDVFKLKALPERVATLDSDLHRLVDTEVGKLRELIEELSNRAPRHVPQVVATGGDTAALEDALNRLAGSHAALEERVEALEADLKERPDADALAALATRAELHEVEARLRAMLDAKPGDRKAVPAPAPAPPSAQRDTATAGALLSLKDSIEAYGQRLSQLEREWHEAKPNIATRDELRDACQETLKAAERAINHIYEELRRMLRQQQQGGVVKSADGTAGRFRCLSCNRDAGPLSEALRERLSKAQFPPSTTLIGRDSRDSPPRVGGRAHVPGGRDASMTSSRRKLQNYYDWLQTKEGSDATRSTTPPRTVYLGAQSGGGGPGRQSGDHGSDDPDAIGADGKYYTGVISRPQSATGSRPRSAPPRKAAHAEATPELDTADRS